jgi:hypothetical protein
MSSGLPPSLDGTSGDFEPPAGCHRSSPARYFYGVKPLDVNRAALRSVNGIVMPYALCVALPKIRTTPDHIWKTETKFSE